jgi:putative inorganic carbon (hco3(-)) transporter
LPIWISDPRFSDWKNYIEMPIIFFLALAAITKPKQMKVLLVLMCIATLLVNHSYHNQIKDRDFSHFSYGIRDAGVLGFAGENGMAAFQAQFLLLILGLYCCEKRLYLKLLMMGIMWTNVYCLLFSFSRGGYAAVLVGITFLGLVKKRSFLMIVAILLLSWQTIVPNAVRERVMMTYTEGEGLDASAETRVDLWQDALEIIKTNPITGTGYDTYSFMHRLGYGDTHNLYLKVALETGVIGLLLVLLMLVRFWSEAYSLWKFAEDPFLAALGLAFAAVMVCSMVVNIFGDRWTYLQVNGYLWALLACVMRGHLIVNEAQASAPPMREETFSGAEDRILDPALT